MKKLLLKTDPYAYASARLSQINFNKKGILFLFVVLLSTITVEAQTLTINYNTPQTYAKGTAITPLAPTSSNIAPPSFNPSAKTIWKTGLTNANDIAIDTAGNGYITAKGFPLRKVSADGNTITNIGTDENTTGVTIDGKGNIYASYYYLNQVKMYNAHGDFVRNISTGFSAPKNVAVDGYGNIYVGEEGGKRIVKVATGTNTVYNIYTSAAGTYTGIITADAEGNVYTVEGTSILKIPAGGGTAITVQTGIANVNGLSVDASGKLYFSASADGYIGMVAGNNSTTIRAAGNLDNLHGLGLDNKGALYSANTTSGEIYKIVPVGGFYAKTLPIGLTLNDVTGVISGTPLAGTPAKDYKVTGYNANASATTNVNINITSSDASLASLAPGEGILSPVFNTDSAKYTLAVPYSVSSIHFTPVATDASAVITVGGTPAPQGEASASVPLDVGDNSIVVIVVSSDGTGIETYSVKVDRYQQPPELHYETAPVYYTHEAISALLPASSGVIAALGYNNALPFAINVSSPAQIATDCTGNVYIAQGSVVEKYSEGGTLLQTFTGFADAKGIAFDAANNLYVADKGAGTIKKIASNGSSLGIIGSGFNQPVAVAVDSAGNVYVSNAGNSSVTKFKLGDGTMSTLASGFTPGGITVTGAGEVFVADVQNHLIKRAQLNANSMSDYATGFTNPVSVAADAHGMVYVLDAGAGLVKKITGLNTSSTIASGLTGATGIAVSKTGVVYVPQSNGIIQHVTPNGGYFISSALPAGLTFDQYTGSISGTPTVRTVAKDYHITAYNAGGGTTATVNIKVLSSSLNNLAITPGTLNKTFHTDSLNYSATVSSADSVIIFKPTINGPGVTLTINNAPVTDSLAVPVTVGDNAITATVITTGDNDTKTYTFHILRERMAPPVNRPLSNNASVKQFKFSTGTALIITKKAVRPYATSVAFNQPSIRLTTTAIDSNATVTVNGIAIAQKNPSQLIPLDSIDTNIDVVITAQDGETSKTYKLVVSRKGSNNATIKQLKVNSNSTVVAGTLPGTFITTINPDITTIRLTTAAIDSNAAIKVNGIPVAQHALSEPVALPGVENNIDVVITAQDGKTVKTYTLIVKRTASNNASIKQFKLTSIGTVKLGTGKGNFFISVDANTPSVRLTTLAADSNATVKVNGIAVAQNTKSDLIMLDSINTTINIL
ncbi:MAG: hypothetical protein EOP51_19420, partial [Sphingobacteriales bacterium]